MNSGRKCERTCPITFSLMLSPRRPRRGLSPNAISSEPRLLVMMIRQLRKETVRPCVSVQCPSSRICRSTLKTSTCAFSISSKSTMEYGFWRTASVSMPPSS